MRNASGHLHQGENEQQGKKANRNTYDISSIKRTRVTWGSIWKFHIIVVQSNSEEMYKKVCCTCKVVFLLI